MINVRNTSITNVIINITYSKKLVFLRQLIDLRQTATLRHDVTLRSIYKHPSLLPENRFTGKTYTGSRSSVNTILYNNIRFLEYLIINSRSEVKPQRRLFPAVTFPRRDSRPTAPDYVNRVVLTSPVTAFFVFSHSLGLELMKHYNNELCITHFFFMQ